jgi:hypothetical protein
MNFKSTLTKAALHFAAWAFARYAALAVFSASESGHAYGLLSGWWCALYVAALCETRLASAMLAAGVFLVVDWTHPIPPAHDITELGLADLLVRVAIFISPIPIHIALQRLRDQLSHSARV